MLLEYRVQHDPEEMHPIAERLACTCAQILQHRERFDDGSEVYGDLYDRYKNLCRSLGRLAASAGHDE